MTDVFPNAVDCFLSDGLRADNVRTHFSCIVIHTLLQKRIRNSNQLAADCDESLLSFQWILLPCRIIPIHITELGIAPNQRKHRLKEDFSQLFSPTFADGGLTLFLARAVFLQFQPSQLLNLLRRVKTSNLTDL